MFLLVGMETENPFERRINCEKLESSSNQVRTSPFHGGNVGSIPAGFTI